MTVNEVKNIIETAVPGATVHVLDPMNDGQHLQAFVISPAFEGQPLFKQQQVVMKALRGTFETVHALGLKTFTPDKWEEARMQYGL